MLVKDQYYTEYIMTLSWVEHRIRQPAIAIALDTLRRHTNWGYRPKGEARGTHMKIRLIVKSVVPVHHVRQWSASHVYRSRVYWFSLGNKKYIVLCLSQTAGKPMLCSCLVKCAYVCTKEECLRTADQIVPFLPGSKAEE